MSLRRYRDKRDFARTPEPRGRARGGRRGRSFVVHKHAARRLHHDLRLELDGVLLSWAVPKGPPTEPGQKALAVRTEDHPLEYGGFEGVIPAGEYGGGTVMLWDRGTWRSEGDAKRALAAGKLDLRLEGARLRGRWTLVRTAKDETSWLLIKRSDDEEGAQAAPPELDRSVATGRTMEEIAAGADRTWDARGERAHELRPEELTDARRAPQPRTLAPQLATLASVAPEGEAWLHELKYDGYRLLAFREGRAVRLVTRGGHDWTERFPTVARAIAELPLERGVLDGELVVLARDGSTDFQALQNSLQEGDAARHVFFAFDLPFCEGHDLRASPLVERKALLARLLAGAPPTLRYSDHVEGSGQAFLERACALALEGVVSKRADARYESRRTRTWLKVKCLARQELVVGGWTEPAGSREHFGALLVGAHDQAGALRYAGKVGTGFTGESLAALAPRLAALETRRPPFVDPPKGAAARGVHWTRPALVVEVAFTEWTAEGSLRHPSFQGLREDKRPAEVVREGPSEDERSVSVSARPDADEDVVAGVELSHPERVLYPEQGTTKLQLARYYEAVAEHVLPHVEGRPLTLVRCPRGHDQPCFYQKHLTEGVPPPVRAVRVPEKEGGRAREYVAIDDLAGLVTLVQLGVLELHPWGARADRLERPDRVVLDLDPGPDVSWARVTAAAAGLRALLDELGLASFLRTTGGKGLHVVVPIERRSSWDEVKDFSRELVAALARQDEQGYVLTASKARRQGRIFLDYLRNARGATAIASYSTRARPGAPVATPIAWEQLSPELDPSAFTVETVPALLARRRDPWAGFFELRQRLTKKARAAVAEL